MTIHDPSFKEWLLNFIDTDTNLGDLSKDVKKDSTFPDSSDKNALMKYIESRTPNEVVHRTLSAAIDLYMAASETHDSFSHREPYQK
ncbi:hypothetical protein D7X98_12160 [bacterium 1XD8-76]|nr:hypothetical protein D7X98_12160 [bacterium 1XD8-76]